MKEGNPRQYSILIDDLVLLPGNKFLKIYENKNIGILRIAHTQKEMEYVLTEAERRRLSREEKNKN